MDGRKTAAQLVALGHAHNKRGDLEEARRCFESAHRLEPKPQTLISAANMALKAGDAAAAARMYEELRRVEAFDYPGGAQVCAIVIDVGRRFVSAESSVGHGVLVPA